MRAAVVTDTREIAARRVPIGECGPRDLRIRVEACGVCGSDLHAQRRKSWPPDLIPGHEIAGRVDAIGAEVAEQAAERGLSLGARVVVEPLATCGVCIDCRAGRDSICPSLRIAGVHRPGGFAELVDAQPARVHLVDPTLSPVVATLIEPLAVALHALDRASGVAAGERLLVLGGGTIGLLCAFAARRAGAREVVVRARHDHQRALAELLGATATSDAGRTIEDEGLASRFEVVIETVGGSSRTLLDAGLAARPAGRIVVLGLFDESPALDPGIALEKELTLAWSNCYGAGRAGDSDFARAARLVRDHREILDRLVTSRRKLSDIADAFERAGSQRDGEVKVVVLVST